MEDSIITSTGWPAPAKINLFLHIIGRRADGYHILQTVFQFIDFGDDLEYSTRKDGELALHANYHTYDAEVDLNIRAARALQARTGCRLGADIRVSKKVPMGGGLGGGSSNAATTLVALNWLWQLNLPEDELLKTALELGADVPVFISGHSAWAEGVGDKLVAIEPEENLYLIIYPGVSVATAEIFGAEELTRNTPPITIRDFLNDGGHNDCETVVRGKYPEVDKAMKWLDRYTRARLTGTGACIFGEFDSSPEAQSVCDRIPVPWQGFVAKGVNRSPLLDRLLREQN